LCLLLPPLLSRISFRPLLPGLRIASEVSEWARLVPETEEIAE
jgi:hypothetical protein